MSLHLSGSATSAEAAKTREQEGSDVIGDLCRIVSNLSAGARDIIIPSPQEKHETCVHEAGHALIHIIDPNLPEPFAVGIGSLSTQARECITYVLALSRLPLLRCEQIFLRVLNACVPNRKTNAIKRIPVLSFCVLLLQSMQPRLGGYVVSEETKDVDSQAQIINYLAGHASEMRCNRRKVAKKNANYMAGLWVPDGDYDVPYSEISEQLEDEEASANRIEILHRMMEGMYLLNSIFSEEEFRDALDHITNFVSSRGCIARLRTLWYNFLGGVSRAFTHDTSGEELYKRSVVDRFIDAFFERETALLMEHLESHGYDAARLERMGEELRRRFDVTAL